MKTTFNRKFLYTMPLICIVMLCVAGILNILDVDFRIIALIELLGAVVIAAFSITTAKSKEKDMREFVSIITEQSGNMANDVLMRFPLAMFILSIDGNIMWYNDKAQEVIGENDLYNVSLPELIPELKWTQILKTTDLIDLEIIHNEKNYNVLGNIIKRYQTDTQKETYSVLLYFKDKTDEIRAIKEHEDEKVDVAVIAIDNYDDIFQSMDDAKSQETIAKINTIVSKWVADGMGVMKKIDSDRYLVFFEHQYLDRYINNKFDILDKVRLVGDEIKESITISVGIGTGGHLIENENSARNSLEMVWGRGGDQVAIKENGQFKFYGGTTKDYEKSTRVKTRMFATALKDMINHADKVIIMGHASIDYDCFGAAIGMSKAVSLMNKECFIVVDNSAAIKYLYDECIQIDEYKTMIINPNAAAELVTKDTLLVILDTHRPSMLPSQELLNAAEKVVLIDHHRRSTDYIDKASLSYLEPYASSTCEMVTEILQYIDNVKKMTAFEAMALYIGILIDTKNFITKTGVRTFEAASYLKRYGVNTMEAKKIFNLSFDDYVKRMKIIKDAEIWNDEIAVSVCLESDSNMRVISSQAADEMLNIAGITASFVIYPSDTGACFCARSLGDINVQLIMEKLGGGGHMTVAGCQIKNLTASEGRELLIGAIKEYLEENKK